MKEDLLSPYSRVAQEALSLLKTRDEPLTAESASAFAPTLLYALASQADTNRRPDLTLALEQVDYLQHVLLNGREVAVILHRLQALKILEIVGKGLSFTEDAWRTFPRTPSGGLAAGKNAMRSWECLLLGKDEPVRGRRRRNERGSGA